MPPVASNPYHGPPMSLDAFHCSVTVLPVSSTSVSSSANTVSGFSGFSSASIGSTSFWFLVFGTASIWFLSIRFYRYLISQYPASQFLVRWLYVVSQLVYYLRYLSIWLLNVWCISTQFLFLSSFLFGSASSMRYLSLVA